MEPPGDISETGELDPAALGFMCGLEIHLQLDTGKLHSRMPSVLFDYSIEEIHDGWSRSSRRLRASEGESGQVDVAARFEQRRNRSFVYIQSPNAGLIELDEAPPLEHDDEAIRVGRTLQTYYPDRDDVRLSVADLFLKKAQYPLAVSFYEDLVPRRGDWAALHGRLAYAHLMSNAPAKAEAAYHRVLELNPDSLLVRHQLAQLFRVHGRDDEALREYRRLVEQQPDHVEGLCQLADLLLERGNAAAAKGYLKRALVADSLFIPALRSMGRLEDSSGHFEDAIQHFSTIANLAPDDYLVRKELGRLYLKTGQEDRSRAELELYERGARMHRMRKIAEEQAGKMVETMLERGGSRPHSHSNQ